MRKSGVSDRRLRLDEIQDGSAITRHKKVDQRLTQLLDEQRSILANSLVGICHLRDRRFVWVNERVCQLFGYSEEDLLGSTTEMLYHSPEAYQDFGKKAYEAITTSGSYVTDQTFVRKDGSRFRCRLSGEGLDNRGDPTETIWVLEDITAEHEAVAALTESEERYRSLVENTSDWIWEVNAEGVYTYSSPRVTDYLGYRPEEIVGKTPFDLMPAKEARRVSALFREHVAGHKPLVRLENVNLAKDGRSVVLETSGVPVFDGADNFRGYRGVDRDITERKEAQQAIRKGEQRVLKSLLSTIEALAITIEKRDPYTSGHQRGVAELAVAIGRELGLDDDTNRGLEMGGLIHDIGKIYIPAEVLTRPGRLTPEEFALVRTHAAVGYDIVKGVDLPWPVTDMILQHHERIDGSGYPAGLKGDALRIESRIIAVADVVEAISSHRPYRPTRGMDAAMVELLTNRGALYDLEAADACIRLIRNKGFEFRSRTGQPDVVNFDAI